MPAIDSQRLKEFYEFGPFRLDPQKEILFRADETVPLQPKTFQILLVLVRHHHQVVTKDDLMKAVWPDTFVEEANLSRNIFLLRKALGESPQDHQYILTVPGRGYRFAEGVRLVPEEEAGAATAQPAIPQARVHKTKSLAWTVAAVILVFGIAGGTIWRLTGRKPVLTEKDTIVLADFVNSTGDPVFDGTLRQGLAIELEQSPFLSIISDQRIQQTLKMMGRQTDAKLTLTVAQELCLRTGSAAVLNGSIAQIGMEYLLTIKAVNCSNGELLASAKAQAGDKNHVLDALGQTASEVRTRLGESLSTVKRFDTPLEQATTISLEALKAYSLGRKAMTRSDWAAAVPFFELAIRLDPDFSMAYARLGTSYRMLGEEALAAENTARAYARRERVSELEKFYIESHYYQQTTGELEKARQVYELWGASYPRDWARPSAETAVSAMLGQYNEGLEESLEELRLNPTAEGYSDLVYFYISLDRLAEAQSAAEEAKAKKFVFPNWYIDMYQLGFLQNDATKMAQQVAVTAGKPESENVTVALEARTAAYFGRVVKARRLSHRAIALATEMDAKEVAATYEVDAAIREALFGYTSEAHLWTTQALSLLPGRDVQFVAALAEAISGDAMHSRALADDLAKRFPKDTIVQFNYLPTIHAQLLLTGGDASKAIDILQTAASYELSGGLYSVYVRGLAYLAAHRDFEAIVEFKKVLSHPGIVLNAPVGALSHLQLGRAYARQGDSVNAKLAYQDFIALWKDADREVPILKQAQAEYAKLQ